MTGRIGASNGYRTSGCTGAMLKHVVAPKLTSVHRLVHTNIGAVGCSGVLRCIGLFKG